MVSTGGSNPLGQGSNPWGSTNYSDMEDRRTKDIKERYLKRISKEALETIQFIDQLADEEIRNKQWFIEWQDKLNEISVK